MINWIFVLEPPGDASPINEKSLYELQKIFPYDETLEIFSLVELLKRIFYKDAIPTFSKKFVRFNINAGKKMVDPIIGRCK